MTDHARLSRSCLPLIGLTTLVALVVHAFPTPTPAAALPAVAWTPAWSEDAVEHELRDGCQQLVGLIERRSPDAAWAVLRLRAATGAPVLGATVQAMAHHGLAIAYRTGSGVAADPAAAALHERRSGIAIPTGDRRLASR